MREYQSGSREDERTDAIRDAYEGWHAVQSCTNTEIVRRIEQESIDILVDLAGHTEGNRLGVFQRRPAPIQLSWLGYFATTGLRSMDYVFLAKDQAAPGCQSYYQEKLHVLDNSQFCYLPPDYCPDVQPCPFEKNGYITFGCFNNTAKLNARVLLLWSRIVQEVPESRLVLKWRSLADPGLRQVVRSFFQKVGIAGERIDLRPASPHREMLRQYGDVDGHRSGSFSLQRRSDNLRGLVNGGAGGGYGTDTPGFPVVDCHIEEAGTCRLGCDHR